MRAAVQSSCTLRSRVEEATAARVQDGDHKQYDQKHHTTAHGAAGARRDADTKAIAGATEIIVQYCVAVVVVAAAAPAAAEHPTRHPRKGRWRWVARNSLGQYAELTRAVLAAASEILAGRRGGTSYAGALVNGDVQRARMRRAKGEMKGVVGDIDNG